MTMLDRDVPAHVGTADYDQAHRTLRAAIRDLDSAGQHALAQRVSDTAFALTLGQISVSAAYDRMEAAVRQAPREWVPAQRAPEGAPMDTSTAGPRERRGEGPLRDAFAAVQRAQTEVLPAFHAQAEARTGKPLDERAAALVVAREVLQVLHEAGWLRTPDEQMAARSAAGARTALQPDTR